MTTDTNTLIRATAHLPTALDTAERAARAAFSCFVDPGNDAAGELIRMLGAEAALNMLLRNTNENHAYIQLAELRTQLVTRYSVERLAQTMNQSHRFGAQLLIPGDDHWPTQLSDLGNAQPYALWARGDTSLLTAPNRTALDGTRRSDAYGVFAANSLAFELVELGHTIVTTLAYGIAGDAARAALASKGRVIAVLPFGVARMTPTGHSELGTRVIDTGVVISELPVGSAETEHSLNNRGRIVTALAERLVIVSAYRRSPAMRLAGIANVIDRPLGVVPGPINNLAFEGNSRLLRDFAASCVTSGVEAADLGSESRD